MLKENWLVAALAAIVMVCGCESSSSSSDTGGTGGSGDDISINSIAWLGSDYSGATKTATITGASMSGDSISVAYEPYSWPRATIKTSVDAICCLFYERGGQIVGGKFDFWRSGGQATKSLHNVRERYQGHSWPAGGAKVYTMNVSVDGRQRTNIKQVNR